MYERVRLGDVMTVNPGINTSGRGAGASKGQWQVRGVSAGDIQNDLVVWDGLETLNIQDNHRTRQHQLQPNDLLLTSRSTSVKAALVPQDVENTVALGSLMIIREADIFIPAAQYLWLYFTSNRGREAVASLMTGAGILHLSPRKLEELIIPMPSEDELLRFVDFVNTSEMAYKYAVKAAEERRQVAKRMLMNRILEHMERG